MDDEAGCGVIDDSEEKEGERRWLTADFATKKMEVEVLWGFSGVGIAGVGPSESARRWSRLKGSCGRSGTEKTTNTLTVDDGVSSLRRSMA